jgi:prepilin peptidase CpaA
MWLPLVGALLVAVLFDLRTRRIPNELCLAIWAMGVTVQSATGLESGLADALLGSAVGFAALLPFYLLGGFGAGDVKLMTAACAWLTLKLAIVAVAATLLLGGVMGLLVAAWYLAFRSQVSPTALAGIAMTSPGSAISMIRGARFPYALAIAAGVGIALLFGESLFP